MEGSAQRSCMSGAAELAEGSLVVPDLPDAGRGRAPSRKEQSGLDWSKTSNISLALNHSISVDVCIKIQ